MKRALLMALVLCAALRAMPPSKAELRSFTNFRVTRSSEWEVYDGVVYSRYELTPRSGPAGQSQRLFLIEVKKDARVRLRAIHNTGGIRKALEPLTELVGSWQETHGETVLAGVNGDFFDTVSGGSVGYVLSDGRWLTAGEFPEGYTAGMTAQGRPVIAQPGVTLTAVLPDGRRLTIDALNALRADCGKTASSPENVRAARTDNYLVLYTEEYALRTGTSGGGTEVRLKTDGPVRSGTTVTGVVQEALVRGKNAKDSLTIGQGHMVLSAIDEKGTALMGLAPGDEVKIECGVSDGFQAVTDALGGGRPDGGPLLIRDGQATDLTHGQELSVDRTYFYRRHPRTIFGIMPDGGYFLLVIEGNRSGSYGMKLEWAQQILLDLGAQCAVNLDGGPSSTMVLRRADSLTAVTDTTGGARRLTPVGSALILTALPE